MLSALQVATFSEEGYLVLPGFAGPAACAALRARAAALIDEIDPASVRTVFDARGQSHGADDYFLSSGSAVRPFLEPAAVAAAGGDGEAALRKDRQRAVNKIGHALHALDPVFAPFSQDPRVGALARQLGHAAPRLIQSMYIVKAPGTGGEVNCHQDATYLYTDPTSVLGLWLALADARLDNGCLWVRPGGHRLGLRQRFVRSGAGTALVPRAPAVPTPPLPERMTPLPVPEGTLVLLHGLLPHLSHANTSADARPAYALHLVDGACDYPDDNWLQPDGTALPL